MPALALLLPALAACGSEDSDSASDSSSEAPAASGSVDGLSVEGEVGETLTVDFDDALDKPAETEISTVVEGDGALGELEAGGEYVGFHGWLA